MPYPYDRAQHQRANAEVLADHGAAVVIDDLREPGPNAARLAEALRGLMDDDARRDRMAEAARSLGRPEAADHMAERLLESAGLSVS
jgi:UDP-N-acetylglucosamine--N-acetylmuramyl-(pentapeptide) pyrophosphoryl-undecaprenol N-acetylglucosamine transferase